MKNINAVILVFAFISAQYAKQVSYLECKLFNFLATQSQQCDCEKILSNSTDNEDALPLSIPHHHSSVDDSYIPVANTCYTDRLNPVNKSNDTCPHDKLAAGLPHQPDHPPQFS